MNEEVFQEISRKLTVVIALLARQDKKITKNIGIALGFFENFGITSNQEIANILGVTPQAVANARSRKKKRR